MALPGLLAICFCVRCCSVSWLSGLELATAPRQHSLKFYISSLDLHFLSSWLATLQLILTDTSREMICMFILIRKTWLNYLVCSVLHLSLLIIVNFLHLFFFTSPGQKCPSFPLSSYWCDLVSFSATLSRIVMHLQFLLWHCSLPHRHGPLPFMKNIDKKYRHSSHYPKWYNQYFWWALFVKQFIIICPQPTPDWCWQVCSDECSHLDGAA